MNKIVLRPWQKQDAQELAAVANNRNIWNNVRDALPNPYTVMDALQWIAYVNDQKPVLNFAIVSNGKVAGSIGCTPKEDISRKTIEIGYFIGEPYWNNGLATEAVKQLMDFITTRLDIVRIEAHVFASNKASMTVLRKNGFYLEAIHRKGAFKNNELIDDYLWVKLL
jgi:ribosomal-protein-alanine N-acetyltransferase